MRKNRNFKDLLNERGNVIVEATIVFPVMFLAIFFMIYVGNAFYQTCKISAIVNEMAVDGAAYCADPLLSPIDKARDREKAVPSFNNAKKYIEPYRCFFGYETVNEEMDKEIKNRLGLVGTGLFKQMQPDYEKGPYNGRYVDFENLFVYSTFKVSVTYEMRIPIRLLGQSNFSIAKISAYSEMPVTDVPEFMRNINMAEDYMQQYGIDKKFDELMEKVKKSTSWFKH